MCVIFKDSMSLLSFGPDFLPEIGPKRRDRDDAPRTPERPATRPKFASEFDDQLLADQLESIIEAFRQLDRATEDDGTSHDEPGTQEFFNEKFFGDILPHLFQMTGSPEDYGKLESMVNDLRNRIAPNLVLDDSDDDIMGPPKLPTHPSSTESKTPPDSDAEENETVPNHEHEALIKEKDKEIADIKKFLEEKLDDIKKLKNSIALLEKARKERSAHNLKMLVGFAGAIAVSAGAAYVYKEDLVTSLKSFLEVSEAADRADLNKKIQTMTTALTTANTLIRSLQMNAAKCASHAVDAAENLSSATTQFKVLNSTSSATIQSLRTNLDLKTKEAEELVAQLAALNKPNLHDLADIQSRYDAASARVKHLEEQIASMNSNVAVAEAGLLMANTNATAEAAKAALAASELQKAKTEVDAIQASYNTCKNALEEKEKDKQTECTPETVTRCCTEKIDTLPLPARIKNVLKSTLDRFVNAILLIGGAVVVGATMIGGIAFAFISNIVADITDLCKKGFTGEKLYNCAEKIICAFVVFRFAPGIAASYLTGHTVKPTKFSYFVTGIANFVGSAGDFPLTAFGTSLAFISSFGLSFDYMADPSSEMEISFLKLLAIPIPGGSKTNFITNWALTVATYFAPNNYKTGLLITRYMQKCLVNKRHGKAAAPTAPPSAGTAKYIFIEDEWGGPFKPPQGETDLIAKYSDVNEILSIIRKTGPKMSIRGYYYLLARKEETRFVNWRKLVTAAQVSVPVVPIFPEQ